MRWLEKRPAERPEIRGIAAYEAAADTLASNNQQIQPGCKVVIFDLPAGIAPEQFHSYTYAADSILIPVMPSEIDVYSATRFVADLLLDAQLDRRDRKLAIVANRARKNTKSFRMLMRFLGSLKIPLIAVLRDSQNYVHAAAHGIGINEMPAYKIKNDIEHLNAVIGWLDQWRTRRLDAEIELEFEQALDELALTPELSEDFR